MNVKQKRLACVSGGVVSGGVNLPSSNGAAE